MKNSLYLLFIITTFLSCKSNTKKAAIDSNATNLPSDSSQALIKKFKPVIQGVWVKADYINKVAKTKSPAEAEDEAIGITIMNINTDKIKGDSLVVNAGYGNHEGGDAIIKFKAGKLPGAIVFNSGDLNYSIENGDTILITHLIDDDTKKIKIVKYVKSLNSEPDDNLGLGMDYLINKNLIAGNYVMTDSLGNNTKVTLSALGKVTGMPGLDTYWISDDIGGEPMNNLDGFTFNLYKKNAENYTFKIIADTLTLYNMKANADSTENVLGKMVYKFVRDK